MASAGAVKGIVVLATGLGGSDVLGEERQNLRRVTPSAATASVQGSLAVVTAVGFDGLGTLHQGTREDADFEIFDQTAKFNDTDDAPRGAAAKSTQLTTIVEDGISVVVKSRSDGDARYYDRRPDDEAQPGAGGDSILSVTVDVAAGTAFFTLTGSIHGEGSAGGTSGCGRVKVTAPDGTVTQGLCNASHTIPIDNSGPLDPGSYTLEVEGGTETANGFSSARAAFKWDLSLVLSGCTILGTPGDDPDLEGTDGDDVICGLSGADGIAGNDGNDTIFGGGDGDDIIGGPGADTVFGGDGDDTIQAGSGNDSAFGGADDDKIFDRLGPNRMLDGGAGLDVVCGSHQRDVIRGGPNADDLVGLGGPDEIHGDDGFDLLLGDANHAQCQAPAGSPSGSQRDTLVGGIGEDTLRGGADRDTLIGGGGKDSLFGEAANDTLNACDGARDTAVSGGPGASDVVRRDNVDPSSGNEVRRPC